MTRDAVRALGKRYLEQLAESERITKQTLAILKEHAPELLAVHGVGPDVSSAMLIAGGENIDRIGGEAAFAHLIGTAPIPASSGKTNKNRLNRGGNRQGNSAAYTVAIVRMKGDKRTRAYVDKTMARGLTKKATIRLLKRYIAREIYNVLVTIHDRHQLARTTQTAT